MERMEEGQAEVPRPREGAALIASTSVKGTGVNMKSVVFGGSLVLAVLLFVGSVVFLRSDSVGSHSLAKPADAFVATDHSPSNPLIYPPIANSSAVETDAAEGLIPVPVSAPWPNPCRVVRGDGDTLFIPSVKGLEAQLARLSNRDKISGFSIFLLGNARVTPPREKAIIYQLEQTVDTEGRLRAMREARKCAVWDFSEMHLNEWKRRFGIEGSLVAMYNQMTWEEFGRPDAPVTDTLSQLRPNYPEERQDNFLHACFYGFMNERRKQMVKLFNESGMRVVMGHLDPVTQADCVARARVIVNVHFYVEAGLETHRIDGAHARGKCVVSERSRDPGLDDLYERNAAVHFVPLNDFQALVRAVRVLAEDLGRVEACAQTAYSHLLRARLAYPQSLHDAVDRLNCN